MKLRFKIIKRLKKYIKLVKFPLICLLLCKAATLPISFISPKMFQIFIDDVINKGKLQRTYKKGNYIRYFSGRNEKCM